MNTPIDKNHRYPAETVTRTVWLRFRFKPSLHDVEEMLLDRGIVGSYESSADGAESTALIKRAVTPRRPSAC